VKNTALRVSLATAVLIPLVLRAARPGNPTDCYCHHKSGDRQDYAQNKTRRPVTRTRGSSDIGDGWSMELGHPFIARSSTCYSRQAAQAARGSGNASRRGGNAQAAAQTTHVENKWPIASERTSGAITHDNQTKAITSLRRRHGVH